MTWEKALLEACTIFGITGLIVALVLFASYIYAYWNEAIGIIMYSAVIVALFFICAIGLKRIPA